MERQYLDYECNRCGKIFNPNETLDAYEEIGYMLNVNRFNGRNIYETRGHIVPLCHDCTIELNEFMYGKNN